MTRWTMLASALVLALGATACTDRGDSEDAEALALEQGAGSCPDGAPMFARFDANHDGVLQLAELPERARAHLAAADTNGDGAIDVAELRAMRQARVEARFLTRDANGDGALDASEVGNPARWTMLALADGDGDGRVTLAELQAAFAAGILSPPCGPLHGGQAGAGPHGGAGGGSQGGTGTCPGDGTGTCPHSGQPGGGHGPGGGHQGTCPHA